jgi:hypothetical protein
MVDIFKSHLRWSRECLAILCPTDDWAPWAYASLVRDFFTLRLIVYHHISWRRVQFFSYFSTFLFMHLICYRDKLWFMHNHWIFLCNDLQYFATIKHVIPYSRSLHPLKLQLVELMMTNHLPALSLTHTLHENHTYLNKFPFTTLKGIAHRHMKMDWDFIVEIIRDVLTAFFICYCSLLSVPPIRLMNYASSNCIPYEDTRVQNLASTIFRGVKIWEIYWCSYIILHITEPVMHFDWIYVSQHVHWACKISLVYDLVISL